MTRFLRWVVSMFRRGAPTATYLEYTDTGRIVAHGHARVYANLAAAVHGDPRTSTPRGTPDPRLDVNPITYAHARNGSHPAWKSAS